MIDSPSYDTPPKSHLTSKLSTQINTQHNTNFDSVFCKNYANIKFANNDAPFDERMQFDIYRRETKMERYEILKNASKKKIPTHQQDLTFQRLQKDSERRIMQKEKIHEMLDSETKKCNKKKMSQKDIENQYKKFMEYEKNKKEIIQEKKKLQEFQKELEICESTKLANKGTMLFRKNANTQTRHHTYQVPNERRGKKGKNSRKKAGTAYQRRKASMRITSMKDYFAHKRTLITSQTAKACLIG